MGFLKPKVVMPPTPPPPPPPPPVAAVKPQEAKRVKERLKDPKRMTRQRTIVTGPRGLTSEGEDKIYTQTLIGSVRENGQSKAG